MKLYQDLEIASVSWKSPGILLWPKRKNIVVLTVQWRGRGGGGISYTGVDTKKTVDENMSNVCGKILLWKTELQ